MVCGELLGEGWVLRERMKRGRDWWRPWKENKAERERERERERGLSSIKWFMILCGGMNLVFSKLLMWHFLIGGCKIHLVSRDQTKLNL